MKLRKIIKIAKEGKMATEKKTAPKGLAAKASLLESENKSKSVEISAENKSSNTKITTKASTKTVKKESSAQKVQQSAVYDENSIQHLEGLEHIRLRPGMYIGSLGDGSNENDGIYILLKEGIDNSVDEFSQGFGNRIDIEIKDGHVKIRDYGRGIPLGKLEDCVSNVNTGAKYNNSVFKQAIGMNGVGIKATNALSSYFRAASIRDGKMAIVEFKKGEKITSKWELQKKIHQMELILNLFQIQNYLENTLLIWSMLKNDFGIMLI